MIIILGELSALVLYENLPHVGRLRLLARGRFRIHCVKIVMIPEVGEKSSLDFSGHILSEGVIVQSGSAAAFCVRVSQHVPG